MRTSDAAGPRVNAAGAPRDMAKGAVLQLDGDAPGADEMSADIACDAAKGNERIR